MPQKISLWRNYEKYNFKPGLQVPVHKAKGSKEEQARIEELGRLGRLFDAADDPRLALSTRIRKLREVRKGYKKARFVYMEAKADELIARLRDEMNKV